MRKDFDLVLVNPGDCKQVYQNLGDELTGIEPPIWSGLLATFIRKHDLRVAIIDSVAENLSATETAIRITDSAPLLTAIVVYGQNPSASTMVMPAAGAICREIKQIAPDQKIIMLGGHVAALPEQTLNEEATDFVCDGEGPYTLLELLRQLKTQNPDLSAVPGLLFSNGNDLMRNDPAALVTDLDIEMPGVAWDLLPMDKYRAHNWHCFSHIHERSPYAAIYTSLGCPFHCDFCCIQAPFKSGEYALGNSAEVDSYRRWSPESVIAQIDILVNKYGVRNLKIADELFVLNSKHVIGICDLIIDRGYELNIWAYSRVDSWNDKMLKKMKRAGINWLCLGIESGSNRVRQDVHKGYGENVLIEAVKSIKNMGIHIIANYLFGLPEDDMESMQQTLNLALELNCEFANFYCAMAYPGSKLYNRVMEASIHLPDSWSGYSQHAYDTLPLSTKHLSGVEVLRFRDQAFQSYFTDTNYLNMIRETYGSEVVAHIKNMTLHRLKRKFLPN